MRALRLVILLCVLFALLGLAYLVSLVPVQQSAVAHPALSTCTAGAPAIGKKAPTSQDVSNYVSNHPLLRNVNPTATIDRTTVVVSQKTLGNIEELTHDTIDANVCPPSTSVWYATFAATGGNFEFLGPHGLTASYPKGFEVFRADNGNLLLVGGR